MKIIKASTKQGQTLLNKAQSNEGFDLYDVYSKFSYDKKTAWEECYSKCANEGGKNFRIIGHNTFQFSVAWETIEGTRIETAQNSYLIKHKLFMDNETGEIITEPELLREYKQLRATEQTDAETFAEYINNCMSYNNGTLDEIE